MLKPKIISWNVRGMNELEKRTKIRGSLREWKADIVCLQETKMEVISRDVVYSVWSFVYVDLVYLGSRGASGGILLMWDRRVVEKIEEYVGRYVVACAFRSVSVNFDWGFPGVYRPNDDGDRRGLWDELAGLRNILEMPWCMGGILTSFGLRAKEGGKRDHLRLWLSFLSLFLNRVSSIFLWLEGDPLGQIDALGPKLIDFCYLQNGRNIFQMCLKDIFLVFFRIIILCFWIVESGDVVGGRLNLKICGCKQKDLRSR
jgi:hypothetical protein